MSDEGTASEPPSAADAPAERRERINARKRRIGISLGTLVALVTLATGILTLRDQLFPRSEPEPTTTMPQTGEIEAFDGVAGHFEESRAVLGFLEQHDGETVQLNVGFPDLAGTDNYIGDPGSVTYASSSPNARPIFPRGKSRISRRGAGLHPSSSGPKRTTPMDSSSTEFP
jgi:hypothetical protein